MVTSKNSIFKNLVLTLRAGSSLFPLGTALGADRPLVDILARFVERRPLWKHF